MVDKITPAQVNQPLTDPETHLLTPQWKRWFLDLQMKVNALQTQVDTQQSVIIQLQQSSNP